MEIARGDCVELNMRVEIACNAHLGVDGAQQRMCERAGDRVEIARGDAMETSCVAQPVPHATALCLPGSRDEHTRARLEGSPVRRSSHTVDRGHCKPLA